MRQLATGEQSGFSILQPATPNMIWIDDTRSQSENSTDQMASSDFPEIIAGHPSGERPRNSVFPCLLFRAYDFDSVVC